MDIKPEKEMEILSQFLSDERKKRIDEVLAERTRYLTLVLEDIYHPPNASAVLRTAECLGIQDIHIIENQKKYKPNSDVAIGASKWLNIYHYHNSNDNTGECLDVLKKKGYKIATTLLEGEGLISPEELPLDAPLALCFGTEETGLSKKAKEMADYKVKIPMFGFTESFNISVSAAISLYQILERLRNSQVKEENGESKWCLNNEGKKQIKLDWHRKCVKNSDIILNHILSKQNS